MQGHDVRAATVDLAAPAELVRDRLLELVQHRDKRESETTPIESDDWPAGTPRPTLRRRG